MSPRYDLIIFDVDGTLVDTIDSITEAAMKAIQVLDLPLVQESEVRKCIGPPLAKTMVQKGLLDEKDFDSFNNTFRSIYKDEFLLDAVLYPGVIDTLKSLYGKVKMAVATNKRYDYTEILLEKMGLTDYFDVIKGTDFENRLNKTDLIEQCLEKTGVPSERAVMIGDTINDKNAAEKASVDFIGVTYGFGLRGDERPEKYVNDIRELPDAVL